MKTAGIVAVVAAAAAACFVSAAPLETRDTADPGQSLVDGAFRTADDALFSFIDPAAKALGMRGLDGAAVDAALVDAED